MQGKLMKNSIADVSVALSLMAEALRLLDEPQHSGAARHLQDAINELLPGKGLQQPLRLLGAESPVGPNANPR
jgi:hypothetical protein